MKKNWALLLKNVVLGLKKLIFYWEEIFWDLKQHFLAIRPTFFKKGVHKRVELHLTHYSWCVKIFFLKTPVYNCIAIVQSWHLQHMLFIYIIQCFIICTHWPQTELKFTLELAPYGSRHHSNSRKWMIKQTLIKIYYFVIHLLYVVKIENICKIYEAN